MLGEQRLRGHHHGILLRRLVEPPGLMLHHVVPDCVHMCRVVSCTTAALALVELLRHCIVSVVDNVKRLLLLLPLLLLTVVVTLSATASPLISTLIIDIA